MFFKLLRKEKIKWSKLILRDLTAQSKGLRLLDWLKDIATNGIEDVERRARNCSKLEHKVGEFEAENKNLKDENKELRELKNDFDKLRRDVKELVRREVEY